MLKHTGSYTFRAFTHLLLLSAAAAARGRRPSIFPMNVPQPPPPLIDPRRRGLGLTAEDNARSVSALKRTMHTVPSLPIITTHEDNDTAPQSIIVGEAALHQQEGNATLPPAQPGQNDSVLHKFDGITIRVKNADDDHSHALDAGSHVIDNEDATSHFASEDGHGHIAKPNIKRRPRAPTRWRQLADTVQRFAHSMFVSKPYY